MRIGGRRTRRWLFISAAGIFAVLIIAGFIIPQLFDLLPDRGAGVDEYKAGVGEVQARMTLQEPNQIGGTLYPSGSEDARHLSDSSPDWPEYSTVPPTSGAHLNRTWECGFFVPGYVEPVTGREGVPDRNLVHNLEHGHVVISYNLPNQEDVDRLREVHSGLADQGLWLISRPYADIAEGQVAMTAWGVLDKFDGVDEQRIKAFFNEYKGNRFSEETRLAGRGIPCTPTQQAMEPTAG